MAAVFTSLLRISDAPFPQPASRLFGTLLDAVLRSPIDRRRADAVSPPSWCPQLCTPWLSQCVVPRELVRHGGQIAAMGPAVVRQQLGLQLDAGQGMTAAATVLCQGGAGLQMARALQRGECVLQRPLQACAAGQGAAEWPPGDAFC